MKKSVIIFLLFSGINVFGQGLLSVGLKGEVGVCYFNNFSRYKSEGFSVDEMGPGHLSYGFTTDVKITKNIFLGCDILYDVQRGGGFKKDAGFTMTNYSTNGISEDEAYYERQFLYKSLDIPLYLKAGIGKRRTLFFLSAGIEISNLSKATYRYNTFDTFSFGSMSSTSENWSSEDIYELRSTTSIAYLLGAGVRVNFKRVVLNPELRFTRFLANEIIVDNTKQNSKNYIFSLSFSIMFH
jgi:opacity protein-like surface antigen